MIAFMDGIPGIPMQECCWHEYVQSAEEIRFQRALCLLREARRIKPSCWKIRLGMLEVERRQTDIQ